MEAALLAKLLATTAITALTGQRVNWVRRPQGEAIPSGKASIVLLRVSGVPDYHMTAASGLVESRVQVDCWAGSYGAAKAAARAVDAALSGQKFTQGAHRFDAVFIAGERDDYFEDATEKLLRVSLDFIIHHAIA